MQVGLDENQCNPKKTTLITEDWKGNHHENNAESVKKLHVFIQSETENKLKHETQ